MAGHNTRARVCLAYREQERSLYEPPALARARDVVAASRLLHEREAVWARLCGRHRPLREGRVLPAEHVPQHVPLSSVAELLEPPLVPVAEEAALSKVLDGGLRKRFAAAGHRAARVRDAVFDLHAYPLAEASHAEVVVASGHWEACTQRATDAALHIQRAELHTGATRDSLRLVLRCLAPARGDKACGARALDITSDDSTRGKLRRLGRLSGRKELAHSVGANLDQESIAARVFHALLLCKINPDHPHPQADRLPAPRRHVLVVSAASLSNSAAK